MRGFTKAAALLSSTFTFAIVIPGTTSSISHLVSGEQAESIVDYRTLYVSKFFIASLSS